MEQREGDVSETDRTMSREAAAVEHLRVALDALEEAQAFVDLAAQALCPLRGFAGEWRAVGALYDRVKRTWHRVSERGQRVCARGPLSLDRDPRPGELARFEALWSRE